MTSAAATHTVFKPHRSWDRVFFSLMNMLILASVLYGFAKTYFLAGMVAAPLPNRLIHIHGAVFTLWIILLIVQTAFISAHQVRIHKKLGMYGFGLAVLMVILGLLAAVDQLKRGHTPHGIDPELFFIIPVSAILLFALFISFAYRYRSRSEAHKRLILIATLSLLDAAVGRWPISLLQQQPIYQDFVLFGFLLLIVLYDLLSLHRFSRTTLWASAVYVVVHLTRVPIGQTQAWHHFAALFLGNH